MSQALRQPIGNAPIVYGAASQRARRQRIRRQGIGGWGVSRALCLLGLSAPSNVLGCDGDVTKYVGSHYAGGGQRAGTVGASPAAPAGGTAGATGPVAPAGAAAAGGAGATPAGCGQELRPGVSTVAMTAAGEAREFHLSVPDSYQPQAAYPIVFGFSAGSEDGEGARARLGLETIEPNDWALFVYPDPLRRAFPDGTTSLGWLNGPTTDYLGGTEDLEFVSEMVAFLTDRLCVAPPALFAVGYGWGGDFSSVVGCYLGDRFAAFVSALANTPYFLPVEADDTPKCVGEVAAWVYHAKGANRYPVDYGYANRDFWMARNQCESLNPATITLSGFAADDECEEYSCQGPRTLFCAYTAEVGYNLPSAYFAAATVEFLQSHL